MITANPNLSVSAPRVPQLYVRKFRLETQEAEAWQVPQRVALRERVRRRAWLYAASVLGASSLLIWIGWELVRN